MTTSLLATPLGTRLVLAPFGRVLTFRPLHLCLCNWLEWPHVHRDLASENGQSTLAPWPANERLELIIMLVMRVSLVWQTCPSPRQGTFAAKSPRGEKTHMRTYDEEKRGEASLFALLLTRSGSLKLIIRRVCTEYIRKNKKAVDYGSGVHARLIAGALVKGGARPHMTLLPVSQPHPHASGLARLTN